MIVYIYLPEEDCVGSEIVSTADEPWPITGSVEPWPITGSDEPWPITGLVELADALEIRFDEYSWNWFGFDWVRVCTFSVNRTMSNI